MTFNVRLGLALAGLVFGAVILAPLALSSTVGLGLSFLLLMLLAWGLHVWLRRSVESPLRDFRTALQDLRSALPEGRPGLLLKSERPSDEFNSLAIEINQLVSESSGLMAGLRDRHRELERTQSLFQSTLENMVEGVVVVQPSGEVLYFNETARQMLDFREREVQGRPLWELVREPALQSIIEDVLRQQGSLRREVEFKRPRSIVEVTAAPLSQPNLQGAVLVFHEVTELRRLEQLRREFVSNVSHELKTPLTSIQAYADTLLEGALDDPDNARLFLTRILEQSDRLQQLIQDILRLARIESQAEAFQLRPVDVATLLTSCIEARRTLARSREIELQLDLHESTLKVLADAGGLQTAIENLVANALNYTPEGGKVRVRGLRQNDQVVVEVADSGIGIATEHHERVFERFYRVDKARSRSKGGTGLGLSIVKHLLTVFHGTVEVESSPGQGSTFRLRMPALREASSMEQPLQSDFASS